MIGFVLLKNGTCQAINSLSHLYGLKFVEKVGNQILFCGGEPVQGQREKQCVDKFINLLFGHVQNIECCHFPVVCYTGQQSACLMETLLF